MTTKIVTLRVPPRVYGSLVAEAARRGVSVSAHARNLIEQAAQVADFAQLRADLLTQVAEQGTGRSLDMQQTRAAAIEVLFLLRALCAETNPQLTGRVSAQMEQVLGSARPRI